MGGSARRARRTREHDPQHVGVLVVPDQRAEPQQVIGRLGREPHRDVARSRLGRPLAALVPPERIPEVVLQREEVVAARLDPHQEAVERGQIDPRGLVAALERLDERGPGSRERIEHTASWSHVAPQELLDELRDELPEIRMQAMDVLRALALGQLTLRPGEIDVQPGVQRILGRRHEGLIRG